MAEYKKYNRDSGPRRDGGNRPFGNRPRPYGSDSQQPRELFDAECSNCHERCQVPFRPNGKKPVFCAKCFSKDERTDSRDTRGPSNNAGYQSARPRPSFAPATTQVPDRQIQELTKQLDVMNQTIGKLVTAVESINRASALSKEVRKHMTQAPAAAPKKAAAAKPAKKVVKKAAAKTAKK